MVTDPTRAQASEVSELAKYGVATIHEAMGRCGLLGHRLRPLAFGSRTAGTAVTVLCAPGDNLMVHVAVEQTKPGDLIVITTTSPSRDGFIGELLVTSFMARGACAIVTTTGVRDVKEIIEMGFPIWSRAISAQGTAKATAGTVNLPIAIGGTVIHPGDVVVGDDDGVVCVPRELAGEVAAKSEVRTEKERVNRERLRTGELGLDMYELRPLLRRLGVETPRSD